MALKDVLATPPAPKYRDKVGDWRAKLSPADRAAFDAAVKDPAWTSGALARVLATQGLKISDNGIRGYRQRLAA